MEISNTTNNNNEQQQSQHKTRKTKINNVQLEGSIIQVPTPNHITSPQLLTTIELAVGNTYQKTVFSTTKAAISYSIVTGLRLCFRQWLLCFSWPVDDANMGSFSLWFLLVVLLWLLPCCFVLFPCFIIMFVVGCVLLFVYVCVCVFCFFLFCYTIICVILGVWLLLILWFILFLPYCIHFSVFMC